MTGLVVLGYGWIELRHLPLPRRWLSWLRSAVLEEEHELEEAIRPPQGRWQDAAVAAASLAVVVAASITMERSASELGRRFAVPEIVVGGLLLAAVTSLPSAVAALYLAARGRGATTLSTALNSSTLNLVVGLLLTALVLALAYRDSGLGRWVGLATRYPPCGPGCHRGGRHRRDRDHRPGDGPPQEPAA